VRGSALLNVSLGYTEQLPADASKRAKPLTISALVIHLHDWSRTRTLSTGERGHSYHRMAERDATIFGRGLTIRVVALVAPSSLSLNVCSRGPSSIYELSEEETSRPE
jgi:hypothetical protein